MKREERRIGIFNPGPLKIGSAKRVQGPKSGQTYSEDLSIENREKNDKMLHSRVLPSNPLEPPIPDST